MKRLVLLLGLAACGPKATKTTTTPVDNGGGEPAKGPPYGGIFESGKSWTFAVTHADSYWDDQDPAADANGNVKSESTWTSTCRVDAVAEIDGGKASHVSCEGWEDSQGGQQTISGLWFMDGSGLYYYGEAEMPEAGSTISRQEGTFFLPAAPEAKQDVGHDNDDDPTQETSFLTIRAEGEGWCRESSFAWGDESWDFLCVDPDGFVSGEYGWAGGSVHETKFELAPGQ